MPTTNAPAQIATGTAAPQQPQVSFSQVLAQCATASGNAGIPATNATSTTFPAARLGIRVDLNLGGVWTDITQYVYQRNPVTITNMGRADWTSTIQPAQLTLTLNDRDGRFSPKNTAGAYYPNITRNTPVRVFVSATSQAAPSNPLNANPYFEVNASSWSPANNATIAQSTAFSHAGTGSLSLHGDGATGTPQAGSEHIAVTVGQSYTATAWYFNPSVWASGVITQINWFDSSNNFLTNSFTVLGSLPGGTWTPVTVTANAPANAVFANINTIIQGTPAVGNIFYVDDAALTTTKSYSYAGFRFYGEVSEWPPRWDPSGRDVSVDIVASGIWRRISQQLTTIGSAYRRYVDNLSGPAVQAYWPMEDGTGSGQLVPFGSPAGTQNALQQFVGGQAGLSLAAADAFPGSDAVPQLNGATIIATVPAGGTPTNNVVRFGISVPAAGDSGSASTNWNLVEIDTAGTVKRFELFLLPSGLLLFQGVNNAGAVTFSGTTTTNVKGQPYLVSMELTPGINFALRLIKAGASGITESVTGSLGSGSVGAVTQVKVNRAFALQDTGFGQLSVYYGSPPLMVPAANALGGYVGEKALDRFVRLCAEQGITTETIGTSSQSAALGPQVDDTLANLLQSIEDTDCGLLYETRDQFGLGYRTNGSMANQQVQATLNYTAAVVDQSLAPAYDDQLTRNNITINNWTGYTQQAVLTSGPMSILNPPNGIGNGYAYQRNVNAAVDTQCPGIANFLLNLGTTDEIRFPVVSVRMIRATSSNLFTVIPNLDIGDYFQITNPPSFLTTTVIKQLMWGYSETLNAKQWDFAFNAVPEVAWETGFSPGVVQTAQIPGGSPVSSQAQGSLGLASLLANGSITPSMLSNGITIHTFGGNAVTISLTQPGNPNVGDIWINASTGLISSWNGSIWAATTFNATNTIQAGTITAALIAAHTIVASNIAVGTITAATAILAGVFAGIVDATDVFANTYNATNVAGEFLAYDVSSPTSGHLVNAIAGSTGTDSVGNAFPKGLYSQQLTLTSQSSAPPSFTNSSVVYTSSQGRLRYLSSSGNDLVLDRCVLDLTTFSMGTQTAAQIMSSTLNYLANEAQVGSEYEIEIDGTITTPTSTTTSLPTYNFSFFIDGAGAGINNVTFGAVMLSAGLTMAYCIRARLTLNTTGAGATGNVAFDGGMVIQFNGVTQFNLGNSSPVTAHGGGGQGSVSVQQITTGVAFDTTANHSLAIYGNWGTSTGTSLNQSAITYRTRKTRRN